MQKTSSMLTLITSTCIVSILRLTSLYAVSNAKDQTRENGQTALWSVLEINIGILCSCLPTLKGLVSRVFPNLFTSLASSEGSADRLGVAPAAKVLVGAASVEDYRPDKYETSYPSDGVHSKTGPDEIGYELRDHGHYHQHHHDPYHPAYRGDQHYDDDLESGLSSSPETMRLPRTGKHHYGRKESVGGKSETASTAELMHERPGSEGGFF
jgi:hypothetical protein